MTPHKQRFQHRPDDGQYGDCFRTAIASLLDLPVDDVPHFCDTGLEEEGMRRADEWLAGRGLVLVGVPFARELEGEEVSAAQVRRYFSTWNPDCHYLLVGRSARDVNHNVVCYGAEVVCDPHSGTAPGEGEEPILGPANDGFFWINVLAMR